MEEGLGQVGWVQNIKGLVSHDKGIDTLFPRQLSYRVDSNMFGFGF